MVGLPLRAMNLGSKKYNKTSIRGDLPSGLRGKATTEQARPCACKPIHT